MQTFLPKASFDQSAEILDYRRLGKQRVEAYQILRILREKSTGAWSNHPATLMWKGYENALHLYLLTMCREWLKRGYEDTLLPRLSLEKTTISYPWWLGKKKFHACHRANLLFKDPTYYKQYNWKEEPRAGYLWPTEEKTWRDLRKCTTKS